ncbi:hypothetical protein E2C01_041411 [Portunus trituberculatus]|uniref:Uncharacterized protein n=1 Tax=Portunus trituberculatus TaxID=210409 RepID=A0A5B7FRU6_PORTR|nr:hypothetical protein [Portunus trituberculatus]
MEGGGGGRRGGGGGQDDARRYINQAYNRVGLSGRHLPEGVLLAGDDGRVASLRSVTRGLGPARAAVARGRVGGAGSGARGARGARRAPPLHIVHRVLDHVLVVRRLGLGRSPEVVSQSVIVESVLGRRGRQLPAAAHLQYALAPREGASFVGLSVVGGLPQPGGLAGGEDVGEPRGAAVQGAVKVVVGAGPGGHAHGSNAHRRPSAAAGAGPAAHPSRPTSPAPPIQGVAQLYQT